MKGEIKEPENFLHIVEESLSKSQARCGMLSINIRRRTKALGSKPHTTDLDDP